ncbi:tripartite tricarboxylate transporter substrate binding protein [Variovorax sp. J22R133]|uniref:Bug family tripartite tricarboxylate transporter substrate binding protein n=1 Tax=Variovorax brevis TaxID=3053503 RepID=UPI002577EEB9|nr:tripartite tricarboxylate transporter substrate binding protein [Variovorax sp. J22R133]MDM0111403.1 tripartite tricarboxylate transporter substrate binding protein [Variovorax sp. J22R133]
MNPWISTAVVAAGIGMATAHAETFPDRPITLLCGFTAGATADVPLRALGLAMSKQLGQPVIVDNKPGASGTLAGSILANAKPDGYTLMQVTNTLIRQPFIVKTSFDPIKDFSYVIGVSAFDFGLVVNANSPWKNFNEFTAYAKKNPGKLSYGTIGIGSVPHQVMHKIGMKQGIDWGHVPYKGSAPGLNDLQGGNVDAISDTTGWAPFVDSGKFRLLAVYGEKRMTRYPNVPTLKELGLNLADDAPWGIAAPKGTPPDRIKKLHDAFKAAMQDPVFQKALDGAVSEPRYMSTADYQKYMESRVPIEKEVVETYGLRQ